MKREKSIERRRKAGGITKWEPRFVEMAYNISLLGATDKELAEILGVSERTIYSFKRDYPAFAKAINEGKTIADSKVAKSGYKLARGFYYLEDHVTSYRGEITVTKVRKFCQPNATMIMYWMNNRHPEKWAKMQRGDVSQHLHLHQDVNLGDIPTEELEMMERIGMRHNINKLGSKN